MAFETNRAEGIDPSAERSVDAGALAASRGRTALVGSFEARPPRAYIASFGLLSTAFTVYVTVVLTSALELSPLSSRGGAFVVLGLGLGVGLWSVRLRLRSGYSGSAARPGELLFARGTEGPLLFARGTEGPLLFARGTEGPLRPSGLRRAVQGVALSIAACGVLATLVTWTLALLLPVGAYDAIGYRLPAVVQWLEAGALVWVRGDDPLRNGYPLGLEVLEAIGFRAFGSPQVVDMFANLFLLAGSLSLLGYARRLGLSRALSCLPAGLFLLVPIHLLNAPSGYADAAFAGCLVVFFIALARWYEALDPSSWLLAELGIAACFGLALKPHGFAFVGASLTVALALRAARAGVGRAVREVGTVFALSAPGLFFAVRNVLMTGNPIYPLELRVGTHVLLRGKSSLADILTPDYNVPAELVSLPSWLRPLWVWLQPYGAARSFDDRLAGFGYAFLLLGLPATAWLCWRAYRLRNELPGLGLLLGLSGLCFLIQPFSFWSRFTSWLWGAAALAIGLSVHTLLESGRGRSALALVSCCLLLALPEALYALHHVKRIDRFGLSLLGDDSFTALTRIAGVDPAFVQRELVGKRHVCRTPWRIGTDDANLDGVAAQLAPRPRMHVIPNAPLSSMLASARAAACDVLIVIGDNPLLARLPASFQKRVVRATAFGEVALLPVLSAEVIP